MSKNIKILAMGFLLCGVLILSGCGASVPPPADQSDDAAVGQAAGTGAGAKNTASPAPATKTTSETPAKTPPATTATKNVAPAPTPPPAATGYTATGGLKQSTLIRLLGSMDELDNYSNSLTLKVGADGKVAGSAVVFFDFKPTSKVGNGKDSTMNLAFTGTTEGNRIGGIVVVSGKDVKEGTGETTYQNATNMGWVAERTGNTLNGQIYSIQTRNVTMEFTATVK